MPRYKVLKSVAHNIGHSFTSLMNFAQDDYTMGHILRFARETGLEQMSIDFITGKAQPAALLREPITRVPQWYTDIFWNMVERSGSERSFVRSATLTLRFDLKKSRSGPPLENPYECEVTIRDDRGKEYHAWFDGWWYVERPTIMRQARRWWNPLHWLQR